MIGESLGNYRIVGTIGEGGMGVVYRAEHVLIGRKVAIKRLLPQMVKDNELVERFFNEARAAAMINHPGLVEVFDFGHHADGSAYIVMELLEGESLTARIAREATLPVSTAIVIARQVASALHAAHEQGIVHRDLKPENIFLIADRDAPGGLRTKVLDFGIAKLAPREDQRSVKTKTGVVFGTPRYMAPEQCRNATNVDRRADIYALGCILYEMLVGDPPFDYNNWAELVSAHMNEAPARPSAREPRVTADVEEIVMRALGKQPADRFATMLEMAMDLEAAWLRSSAADISAVMFTPPAGHAVLAPRTPKQISEVQASPTLPVAAELSMPPPLRRRRAPLIVAGALVAAAGGAVAYVALTADDTGTKAVALAPPIDATTVTAVAIDAPPAPDAAVDPVPPPPQRDVVRVQLVVKSTPPGADVLRAADGVRLGKTPFARAFDRIDGEIEFLVKLAGYRDARVTLSTTKDNEKTVRLVRLHAGTRPPDDRGPPEGTKPQGSGATVLDPYEDKPK
jgi:eukaryotic-like serine/threonine-protein kinase